MVTSPFRFDYAPLETLQRSTAVFGRLIMEPKVHRPLPQKLKSNMEDLITNLFNKIGDIFK